MDYAGTHYFTQGTFGGQLVFYVKVNEEIYKYMKKSEVSKQVGAYVSTWLPSLTLIFSPTLTLTRTLTLTLTLRHLLREDWFHVWQGELETSSERNF